VMSPGDEVRMTANDVQHTAFGPLECAIKIAASRLSLPIVRRRGVDLEEKHEPRGA
jgi:hypothetical protein